LELFLRSLGLGICIALSVLVTGAVCAGTARADAPTPTPVQVAGLVPTTWRTTVQVSAQIDAEQNASLAAERPGRVVAVLYTSGEAVATGTLLVKLDDAAEQAQLAVDTAKLTEAENTLARAVKLLSIAGASRASLEQAQADAAEDRAQLIADRAAIAQLNIAAPFAGTLGIRKISAGDYINQGQVVAQITQAAPLRVLFSVPQTEAGGISLGEPFTLQAAAMAQKALQATGKITALSPQVDITTDARDGEGLITGGDTGLLPGMLGTLTLQTGAPMAAYLAPATALNDSVLGRYVFVLQPAANNGYTLKTVYVTEFGQTNGQAVIATTGLVASDRIVALGGFNLTDGASVTPAAP
jgi:RND family efflux transporter MFP subunit